MVDRETGPVHRASRAVGWAVAAAALVACSPAYDWREVRPAGTGAKLLFPCKPTSETRTLQLTGQTVPMTMWACTGGDGTFAIAFADVGDPARADRAIAQLLKAQAGNLQAALPSASAPVLPDRRVPGLAVPAQRHDLVGRYPDGTPVRQRLLYGTTGGRLFQAAVLGDRVPAAEADAFFESIAFVP